jgi:hypothetical protein
MCIGHRHVSIGALPDPERCPILPILLPLILTVVLLIALDIAAIAFGVDSREDFTEEKGPPGIT